jgi:hypothetical protein
MLAHTRKLQLADPKDDPEEDLPIEILIGGDHYWKIVKDSSPIRISALVVLIPSKLGWILSGKRSGITVNSTVVNYINLDQTFLPPDDAFRYFWELETIGITADQEKTLCVKNLALLQEFQDSYRTDHRRVVSLPKIQNIILSNNCRTAEKRFASLQKRLQKNEPLQKVHYAQILDYIQKRQVEIALTEGGPDTFYLPHQAVQNEKHGNIKWRIVFNASSYEDK